MTRSGLITSTLGTLLALTARAWAESPPAIPTVADPPSPTAAAGTPAPAPLAGHEGPGRSAQAGEAAPLGLTLADAITRGLEHNLAAVLAREGVNVAGGARLVALSGVLPSLSGDLVASRQKISLEQYGFPVAPGQSPLIGPFDVVLGQLSLSQVLFDMSAVERARAGGEREDAARLGLQDARDMVVSVCAGLYLQAVTASSRVEAAQAQLTTAEALARRAQDLKQAGVVAGIEVLRADVQLAAQRQRLIQASNELDRGRLTLARAIGLPLGQAFELVDKVPYAELDALDLEKALSQARAARPDLAGARVVLRAAEDDERAAVWQGLPSLHLDAAVGRVGARVESVQTVYSAAAMVRIPLFEGGRTRGQIRQTRAALEQQRARVADLETRVEYEVRTALLDLKAAAEQVQVARVGHELAQQQLVQSEDRFAAGVASNIEVVQAQQALAEATESYIGSLLAHNLAKLALARSLGVAEAKAGHFLGGAE